MTVGLPDGWHLVPLKAVNRAHHQSVNPEDYQEEVFEYFSIPAFQKFGRPVPAKGCEILSTKLLVENGTVLFGKLNPRVLKVWLVDTNSAFRKLASTEFLPLLANEHADPQFLYYLCHSSYIVEEAQRLVSGSTPSRQRVDPMLFYQIEVPLPPLPEQRAIARALRAVQDAKAAHQREATLERERKAALMQYLFTHGTRNEPRKQTDLGVIPESWHVVRLGDYCESLQYGTSVYCDTDPSGVPVLRIPNVIGGVIDASDLKYVKLPVVEASKLKLAKGDLLFVRTNGNREYTGRCAVFNGEPNEALFASYLIRAKLNRHALVPHFVQFYTMTAAGHGYLSGRSSNAADGKYNINTQTIRRVLIPLPSLDEQCVIADTVISCDTKIAALDREVELLDELFRALLDELMTGRIRVPTCS